MTDFNEPGLLADWLDAHPGELPPEGLDPEVIQAVYVLRPDLAPAPRVSVDQILRGVTTGPFAQEEAEQPAFGGVLSAGSHEDMELHLGPTIDEVENENPQAPPASDLDEVDPIRAEEGEIEVTPIVGVTGTDPLAQGLYEATDPELPPIDTSIVEEHTSPSGRRAAFGVVEAPRPPELAEVEPPPSLRNRAVVAPPKPGGPLSAAGLPTSPPRLVPEDEPVETPIVSEDQSGGDLTTDPGHAEVVDLTAHPRWGGRRLWTVAGTATAAAIVLFAVVPSTTLQNAALSPGRMASESAPLNDQAEPSAIKNDVAEEPPMRVNDRFQPNQRLDSTTRAVSGSAGAPASLESASALRQDKRGADEKKDSDGEYPVRAPVAEEEPAAQPESAPPASARLELEGMALADAEEEFAGANEDWDDVPVDAFAEGPDDDAMSFEPAPPVSTPSLAVESARGDWGVASKKAPTSGRERRKSERSQQLTTSDEVQLEGGLGTLKESSPGTGPESPSPHEMDALRSEAKPMDYRSDWYLMVGNVSEATLEKIRKVLQEADADTRQDDYGHAASVVARLIDEQDPRLGQDFAGRAAVWYMEAGDTTTALAVIKRGKARGSANTPYLARLLYLEGKALESQRKGGWAAESYRAAKALNDAR